MRKVRWLWLANLNIIWSLLVSATNRLNQKQQLIMAAAAIATPRSWKKNQSAFKLFDERPSITSVLLHTSLFFNIKYLTNY